MNSSQIENDSDTATGNDTCPRTGRFQQHASGAETTDHLMRNCCRYHRNRDDILLGILRSLSNCFSNLTSLTGANSNVTGAVTGNDHGREGKIATAFAHVRHAANAVLDNDLGQFEGIRIDSGQLDYLSWFAL